MTSFRIVEHKVPGQHIREYANATANAQEEVLYINAKQYIPRDNPNPRPGDVTIIGAHANGFPKELYEPLWEDLLHQSHQQGWRIRSIWMADVAFQGRSGQLNAKSLGNDPGWFDHARDLMHLINLKRAEMPRPIIGVGHSMGGVQLTYLALMHPRLMISLVLLDTTILKPYPKFDGTPMARLSTFRRTDWPSRKAAVASFKSSPFYKSWDSRVLQMWLEHGVTEVPTGPDSNASQGELAVTLTTPAAQEVFGYYRPNFEGHGTQGRPMNRLTHPDIDEELGGETPFYRPEMLYGWRHLPELRPSVFYIFAGNPGYSNPKMKREMASRTGIGIGGSGGPAIGRVREVFLKGVGHLIPMENPKCAAQEAAAWIGDEMRRFHEEEQIWQQEWLSKSLKEKQEIGDKFKEMVGGPFRKAKM